jgi:putative FmdB family regulatory protein
MPIFLFGCDECDHAWDELMIRSDAKPPSVCPKCNASDPKKRMTSATHRFRPSEGVGGWERNEQGALQRVVDGRNSTSYGEGSV